MCRAIPVWIILITVLASCTKDRVGPDSCPGCPITVSFKADIIPILQANCASGACHAPPTLAKNLNYDSAYGYASAIDPGSGNVDPGNPKNSVLWQVLQGNGMPLYASPLPPCQIQEIYCWIQQGGKIIKVGRYQVVFAGLRDTNSYNQSFL